MPEENNKTNPLEDFLKDSGNLVNVPNKEILEKDVFEELVIKAIVVLLTEMKVSNAAYQELMNEAIINKNDEKMQEAKQCLDEIQEIENQYLYFENNLDNLEDFSIKSRLKEKAREILVQHL